MKINDFIRKGWMAIGKTTDSGETKNSHEYTGKGYPGLEVQFYQKSLFL